MIYVYEAGAWKALDTTVVGNKATAMVTHFSTFVRFAEKVAPTVAPTPTEPVPIFGAVFANFFAPQKHLLKKYFLG